MEETAIMAEATAGWKMAVEYAPRLVGALIVLFVGGFAANWLSRLLERKLQTSRIDPTFRPTIALSFHYVALGLVGLIVLQQFGVQTASLLAVLGTAGLAIGLALQNTLSNVAAGLVLLVLRPFEIGDQVAVSDQSGVVLGLALFHTKLRTDDGVDIVVPNNDVLKNAIRNMSHYPDRVMRVSVQVAASADLDAALAILSQTLVAQPLVIASMARSVEVVAITGASSEIAIAAWVRNADYAAARSRFLCEARAKLKAAGLSLA
jgi:small conductance mechanosensitive channel